MHIGAKLKRLGQQCPDRIAISDETAAWSYAQLVGRINRFGHAMHGLGLAKGDRIALLLPDIREYLESDYGTMSARVVRVPMDPRLTRNELIALMRHAGVRALVTHAAYAEKVEGLAAEIDGLAHIVCVGGMIGDAATGPRS